MNQLLRQLTIRQLLYACVALVSLLVLALGGWSQLAHRGSIGALEQMLADQQAAGAQIGTLRASLARVRARGAHRAAVGGTQARAPLQGDPARRALLSSLLLRAGRVESERHRLRVFELHGVAGGELLRVDDRALFDGTEREHAQQGARASLPFGEI